MVAVGRQRLVACLIIAENAQRDRFLPDIQMQVAAHFVGPERAVALFFKVADIQHLLVGMQQVFIRQFEGLDNLIRRGRWESDTVRVIKRRAGVDIFSARLAGAAGLAAIVG